MEPRTDRPPPLGAQPLHRQTTRNWHCRHSSGFVNASMEISIWSYRNLEIDRVKPPRRGPGLPRAQHCEVAHPRPLHGLLVLRPLNERGVIGEGRVYREMIGIEGLLAGVYRILARRKATDS